MCPFFPVDSVHVILGNNLAGSRVSSGGFYYPSHVGIIDENVQRFPEVFSACAVTRAMSRADTTVKTKLTQHIAEQFDNPLNDLPLPMSCSDLVME